MASRFRALKRIATPLRGLSWARVAVAGVMLTAVVGVLYLLFGLEQEVETAYGRRREGKSVNGTAVLADMFEQVGHRVVTWRSLSPAIDRAHTIVWFPDDYRPPSVPQVEFLENWLTAGPGRTLIYVGRDFDAATDYWKQVGYRVTPTLLVETRRRWAKAQAAHDYDRVAAPDNAQSRWFTSSRLLAQRRADSLQGPWSEGIEVERTAIMLGQALLPALSQDRRTSDRLLASQGAAIVTRLRDQGWQRSQIILVNNGSFLLNLPLVNLQHRKLAGRLIAGCEPGLCVFLETGVGGPRIENSEPQTAELTGFEVLTVWPISPIALHLVALGLVACFLMFPIFGKPRTLEHEHPSDFGMHVQALGDLLYRVKDKEHAWRQINLYRQTVRGESGRHSHVVRGDPQGILDAVEPEHAVPEHAFQLSFPATPEFVLRHAQQAADAAQQSGYQLDYSIGSLTTVDEIVHELRAAKKTVPEVGSEVFQLGCYAGETMRRFHGGHWHHPDESERYRMISSYMVVELPPAPGEQMAKAQILNPIGKTLNMLRDDLEGTLKVYHEMIQRSGTFASNDPQPE